MVRSLTILLALNGVFSWFLPGQLLVWETSGFEDFRQGEFDSGGVNLYVSKRGVVQAVHRFDVNQDGFFDLVFANTHDRIHVVPSYQYRFKAGNRNDFTKTEYPGAGSFRIVATDLNGDKLPELIIGRGDDNVTPSLNTYIYWGIPAGWDERYHTELLTPNFRELCTGDLNNDGDADIITISGSNLLIYWGQPNGFTYQNKTSYSAPSLNSCQVVDLDGDHLNDLVVTGSGNTSRVIWGAKNGFQTDNATQLPVGTSSEASTLGSRLVLATPSGPRIYTVNVRKFSLDEAVDYPESGKLESADLDGDGIQDLVVSRTVLNGNYVTTSRIFWGKSKDGSETYFQSRFTDLPTLGASDVAISDVDSDGFKDIIFANSRDNDKFSVPSYIYWGASNGYTETRRSSLLTHGAQSVSALGPDVFFANNVIARRRGDVDSFVYLGSKQGLYSTDHLLRLPTVGAYEGCLSDLNDDGYVDALFANSYEDAPDLKGGSYIFWGNNKGLSPSNRTMVPSRTGIGCAVGDLNFDGFLDLLISNFTQDSASLFFGGPDNDYSKHEQILQVRDPRFPSIADLNKDGFLDLLVPSVKEGLHVFWGSQRGYTQNNLTLLPGIGPVAQQIADLNGDGYLDIVLCNLVDESNRLFHGINSYIYWGSSKGYSSLRRMDLPSIGGEYSTIADLNGDHYLDIFMSNYQSEFERFLDSYIYWGNHKAIYNDSAITTLRVGSASGAVSADFNGDGWIDIAVANHYEKGSHLTNSYVFWNGPDGFENRSKTPLPTTGAHLMTGVDPGNIYTRDLRETYTSKAYDAGSTVIPIELRWEGTTHFDTKLGFEIRSSPSMQELREAPWQSLGSQSEHERRPSLPSILSNRWWQYRVIFFERPAASPALNRVLITFKQIG
jgi:hypothetical protein